MPLGTVQKLREWFEPVAEISDARLDFCLSAAERTLRQWVGDEHYEEASTAAETEAINKDLTIAEAYLAMHNLLLNTATRLRAFGLVKQEQDAGGSVTNNVINEYLSPTEIARLRDEYYRAAEERAAGYRLAVTAAGRATSVPILGSWVVR